MAGGDGLSAGRAAIARGAESRDDRPEDDARGPRDPRLDVFRGVGMFIILIAHIPGNAWAD